ncbi:hypothetical protein CBER1_08157 [Cercospora berteroae]|uniref:HAT C-terminal dimerisation domain-containing protein n=1 Tax=Cercospora berteroae TaxID=357750 RepID=A0A2S6CLF1_9PEZI|nr:hypothetical protein CBER1_08157 [Cercospora berteroae]
MSAVYPAFNLLKERLFQLKIDPAITTGFNTSPVGLLNELRQTLSSRYDEIVLDYPLTLIAYLSNPFERAKWNSPLTSDEWTAIKQYLHEQQAIYKSQLPYSWASMSSIQKDPQLTKLIKKALSIRISTGPAKRNWSAFGIIHTKKRNRLSATRAGKLTKLYWNRRVRDNDIKGLEAFELDLPDPATVLQPHYLMEHKGYAAEEEAIDIEPIIDHTGETTADDDNSEDPTETVE